MRMLLLCLGLLTCISGCARPHDRAPVQLQVIDSVTGAPVDAILVVRTLDPRHPLSVADLIRPEASSRRTYRAKNGILQAEIDPATEQADLVARGYEAVPVAPETLGSAHRLVVRLAPRPLPAPTP